VKEEELVEKALESIDQVDSKGESFEKAKKELENLQAQYSDGVEGNEKIITFSTFDFLQKNSGTLFRADGAMIGEPLKMAHRLKFVQKEYNDGADWVGVCFAVYNGMASVFAFFLMWLAKVTNRKMTHAISLLVGAISFVSIFFIANPWYLLISFIGIGLAWASILAMPYAILTGSIPSDKMGYYMGVFNFFIVIPQILAATILGFLVAKVFDGQAIYISLVAAGAFALAALLTMRVYDKDDVVG
jgi:maltose/moltooligosaccharide transporter